MGDCRYGFSKGEEMNKAFEQSGVMDTVYPPFGDGERKDGLFC